MQISATIADWELLREARRRDDPDGGHGQSDAFTRWNDSFRCNTRVGELFLAVRGQLPANEADALEMFLAAVCPAVSTARRREPPRDPSKIEDECDHAALSPSMVREYLARLGQVDLPAFFARIHGQLEGQGEDAAAGQAEVVEFVFMWAAAFGQAAALGWGLVVTVD